MYAALQGVRLNVSEGAFLLWVAQLLHMHAEKMQRSCLLCAVCVVVFCKCYKAANQIE